MQSDNMKLGTKLNENLEIIEENMGKISLERQNIAKLTQTYETNLKEMEILKKRYENKIDENKISQFQDEFDFTDYHRNVQRNMLEKSPKFVKTLKNIYRTASEKSFTRQVPDEKRDEIQRAAKKFLESCKKKSRDDSICTNFTEESDKLTTLGNDFVFDSSYGSAKLTSTSSFTYERPGSVSASLSMSSPASRPAMSSSNSTGFDDSSLSDIGSGHGIVLSDGEVLSAGEIK